MLRQRAEDHPKYIFNFMVPIFNATQRTPRRKVYVSRRSYRPRSGMYFARQVLLPLFPPREERAGERRVVLLGRAVVSAIEYPSPRSFHAGEKVPFAREPDMRLVSGRGSGRNRVGEPDCAAVDGHRELEDRTDGQEGFRWGGKSEPQISTAPPALPWACGRGGKSGIGRRPCSSRDRGVDTGSVMWRGRNPPEPE